MPVMSEAEAKAASAAGRLEAAGADRDAVRERFEAVQRDYLAASEVWIRAADEPESERARDARTARETSQQALDQLARDLERAEIAYYRAFVAHHGGRVEFEGTEEWAELETRPDHAQYVALRKAAGHVRTAGADNVDELLDGVGKIVRILLRSWHMLDRDGAELPLTDEGLRRCPWDRMKPIYERAMAIHRGIPDPNR